MSSNAPTVVANHRRLRNWLFWLLLLVLAASLFANYWLWSTWNNYFSGKTPVQERFHSGDESAKAKIALLRMSGTIMPPFTERLLDAIDSAAEDDAVRGGASRCHRGSATRFLPSARCAKGRASHRWDRCRSAGIVLG